MGINFTTIIILALQAICIIHLMRNDKPIYWLILIIILPFLGCLLYIITQMIKRGDVENVQTNLNTILNPGAKIQELEKQVQNSDSFDNKVALADAYLQAGRAAEAVEIYESCLKGIFKNDPYVLMQIGLAYFELKEFEKAVEKLSLVAEHTDFRRSRAHLAFALALDETGHTAKARKQFEAMNARRSHLEFRYHYAMFLNNHGEIEEARKVLEAILSEVDLMDKTKKQREAKWIKSAQTLLEEIQSAAN